MLLDASSFPSEPFGDTKILLSGGVTGRYGSRINTWCISPLRQVFAGIIHAALDCPLKRQIFIKVVGSTEDILGASSYVSSTSSSSETEDPTVQQPKQYLLFPIVGIHSTCPLHPVFLNLTVQFQSICRQNRLVSSYNILSTDLALKHLIGKSWLFTSKIQERVLLQSRSISLLHLAPHLLSAGVSSHSWLVRRGAQSEN